MCVLYYVKPLFLPVHIESTTSVRSDSSILEEIRVPCSQSYAAEILCVDMYAVSTVGNTVSCQHTGYDRHDIRLLWKMDTKQKKEIKNNKKGKSKENMEEENYKKQKVVPTPQGHLKTSSWKAGTAVLQYTAVSFTYIDRQG